MYKNNHPWRRSGQFVTYTGTLAEEQRQRIKAAEQAYVEQENDPTSERLAVAKAHAEVMFDSANVSVYYELDPLNFNRGDRT